MANPEPEIGSVREFCRKLLKKVVPGRFIDRAKAVIGAYGSILLVVNAVVPEYGDEAKAVVGVVLSVATFLGVYEAENVE